MNNQLAEVMVVITLISFLIIFFPMVFIIGLDYTLSEYSCYSKSQIMNKEYKYAYFQGCMIKINEEWIPINNYKIMKS